MALIFNDVSQFFKSRDIDFSQLKTTFCRPNFVIQKNTSNSSNSSIQKNISCLTAPQIAKLLCLDIDLKPALFEQYKDILSNEKIFREYLNLIHLISTNYVHNLRIKKSTMEETKLCLIKEVQQMLHIKTLDIDTEKHKSKFYNIISVNDHVLNEVIKIFNLRKDKNKIDDFRLGKFKNWYYQLVHMYQNVCNHNLFTSKTKHKGLNIVKYVLNKHIVRDNLFLHMHQNLSLRNIESYIIEFCDINLIHEHHLIGWYFLC